MSDRISAALAKEAVQALWPVLLPHCERLEIAGSLRRGLDTVKDVELVAVPKMVPDPQSLFEGEPVSAIALCLDDLLGKGVIQVRKREDGVTRIAWGVRERALVYEGVSFDIFSVLPPAQWGMQFLIRTGPYQFGRWLVTSVRHGGAMPLGMRCWQGALWRGGEIDDKDNLVGGELVPTPEEIDVFNALDMRWIDPSDRQPPNSERWR